MTKTSLTEFVTARAIAEANDPRRTNPPDKLTSLSPDTKLINGVLDSISILSLFDAVDVHCKLGLAPTDIDPITVFETVDTAASHFFRFWIEATIVTYVRDQFVAHGQFTADSDLVRTLSKEQVIELMYWIEKEFDIHVDGDDVNDENFGTVRRAAAYIEQQITDQQCARAG